MVKRHIFYLQAKFEEYEVFLEGFEDLKIAIARKDDEILSEKQALDYIMS